MGLRDVGFLTPSTALPCNSPPDEVAETEDGAGDNFDVDVELGNVVSLDPNDFVGALAVDNLGPSFGEVDEDFVDDGRTGLTGCTLEEEFCVLTGVLGDILGTAVEVEGDRGGFLFDDGDIFGDDPTDDDGDDLVEDPFEED